MTLDTCAQNTEFLALKHGTPVALRPDSSRGELQARDGPKFNKFPTHLWGVTWWEYARQAGGMAGLIDSIGISDPPGDAETKAEIVFLNKLQHSDEYDGHLGDITAEDDALPVDLQRMLYAGKTSKDGVPLANTLTDQLIMEVIRWSIPIIMCLKQKYARARPYQIDPGLLVAVDPPGHPAYPSGHSTQLHLIALVIAELLDVPITLTIGKGVAVVSRNGTSETVAVQRRVETRG